MNYTPLEKASRLLKSIENLEQLIAKRSKEYNKQNALLDHHIQNRNISLLQAGHNVVKRATYIMLFQKLMVTIGKEKRGLFLMTRRYRKLLESYNSLCYQLGKEKRQSCLLAFQNHSPMEDIKAKQNAQYNRESNMYTTVISEKSITDEPSDLNTKQTEASQDPSHHNKDSDAPVETHSDSQQSETKEDDFIFAG